MKTIIINFIALSLLTLVLAFNLNLLPKKVVAQVSGAGARKVLEVKSPVSRQIASEDSDGGKKTIVFNYNFHNKPLKLTFKGVSWDVALKEGANKCMDYYTDGKRAQVDEELYLDLIDICVNPR
jgi:hypothetical protein